jgi:hypothetical protein
MTVGSAITAEAPRNFAAPSSPSERRISASGSGLFAKPAKCIAPIATAATTM